MFGVPTLVHWVIAALILISFHPGHSVAEVEVAPPQVTPYSIMDPHPVAHLGPWFEGYYTRIIDQDTGFSFATITTSYLSPDEPHQPGDSLKAYVALFLQERDQGSPLIIENFPSESHFEVNGSRVYEDRSFLEETNFKWVSKDVGYYSEKGTELKFRSDQGAVLINVEFIKPKHWSDRSVNWGPEGALAFIKSIPLHWYVYSLASEVNYSVQLPDGRVLTGQGLAHREKNWGKVFPQAWMWGQAVDKNQDRQIALAGGLLDLPIVRNFDSFLLGYRSKTLDLSFTPATAQMKIIESDSCQGRFVLEAHSLKHSLKITATAPPDSFGILSIPTKEGYVPGAIESFKTKILVEVFERPHLFGEARSIEKAEFELGALEFGADYNTDCSSPVPLFQK